MDSNTTQQIEAMPFWGLIIDGACRIIETAGPHILKGLFLCGALGLCVDVHYGKFGLSISSLNA